MVEDVYEAVAGLELVEVVLAVTAGDPAGAEIESLTWPGTRMLQVEAAPGPAALEVAAALARLGAEEVTVVAGDAPDLPPLLVGKLHRGLGSAEVAVLPCAGGGLVALACRCPVPGWLTAAGVGTDTPDAMAALRSAAPRRTAVSVGPGWHRVRSRDDLARLDPGLEGWEATRAAVSAGR